MRAKLQAHLAECQNDWGDAQMRLRAAEADENNASEALALAQTVLNDFDAKYGVEE